MHTFLSRAALLAASSLFAVGALAKDEPPAADPKAVEVIRELGLAESRRPRCATCTAGARRSAS